VEEATIMKVRMKDIKHRNSNINFISNVNFAEVVVDVLKDIMNKVMNLWAF
jgi:hypothetical protein